jgi:hypothetical protein
MLTRYLLHCIFIWVKGIKIILVDHKHRKNYFLLNLLFLHSLFSSQKNILIRFNIIEFDDKKRIILLIYLMILCHTKSAIHVEIVLINLHICS